MQDEGDESIKSLLCACQRFYHKICASKSWNKAGINNQCFPIVVLTVIYPHLWGFVKYLTSFSFLLHWWKKKKKKRLMPDEIPTFVEVWFISAGNFYRWEKNCWKLVKLPDVNYYRIKNINKILCVKLV